MTRSVISRNNGKWGERVCGKAMFQVNSGGASRSRDLFLADATALGVKKAALALAGYKLVV